jgi:hypothetical protein
MPDIDAVGMLRREMLKKVNEILEQVKLTNGRVTRIEKILLFVGGISVGLGILKFSSILGIAF